MALRDTWGRMEWRHGEAPTAFLPFHQTAYMAPGKMPSKQCLFVCRSEADFQEQSGLIIFLEGISAFLCFIFLVKLRLESDVLRKLRLSEKADL